MTTCRGYKTSLDLSETPAFSVRVCLSLGSLFFNTSNPIIKSSNLKENDKKPKWIYFDKKAWEDSGSYCTHIEGLVLQICTYLFWPSQIISFLDCLFQRTSQFKTSIHRLKLTLTHQAGKSFFLLLPQLAAPEWTPTRVTFTRSPFSLISLVKSGAPLSPWQGP